MRAELHRVESKISSLKTTVANKKKAYENTKRLIQDDSSGRLAKHYNLDELLDEIQLLENEQERLQGTKKASLDTLPAFEDYLKLFSSTSVILDKIRDMKQMDVFIRIFFSNFTIEPLEDGTFKRSKVSYKLKEPWNGFLESNDFVRGGVLQPSSNRI